MYLLLLLLMMFRFVENFPLEVQFFVLLELYPFHLFQERHLKYHLLHLLLLLLSHLVKQILSNQNATCPVPMEAGELEAFGDSLAKLGAYASEVTG